MNKKILKVLSIILLFFIVFFINTGRVSAATEKCKMYSPFSFVGANNKLVYTDLTFYNKDISFDYLCGVQNATKVATVLPMLISGEDNCWNNKTGMEIIHMYPIALSLKLDDDKDLTLGVVTGNNDILYEKTLDVENSTFDIEKDNCPRYIKVTCDDDYDCNLELAYRSDYKKYLSEEQFKMFNQEGYIYNVYNVKYDKKINFYELLQQGAIFRINQDPTPYPKEQLTKYNEYINSALEKGYILHNDYEGAMSALSVLIDLEENDNRSYDSAYYEATKSEMVQIYNDLLFDTKHTSLDEKRRNVLNSWFYYAGRYVFEDDLDLFIRFSKLIYENANKDIINDDQFESLMVVLDNMMGAVNTDDKIENLKTRSCYVVCKNCIYTDSSYNSSGCTECEKGTSYKECVSCFNTSLKSSEEKKQTDFESCLSGKGLLETYKKNYEEHLQALLAEKDEAIKNMSKAAVVLNHITLAEVEKLNIKFNSKYYPKCEDWTDFHKIYLIIVILAPILVIILGSLDFIKAMASSDEQKIKKFKEKFPKRIIALILLILLPIIISFLTSNIAGLNNSIMYYVVNGCN